MKLIILDRDGVINLDSPHYIKHPDEWIPIPNSLLAIANLYHQGYHIAIATNQSGLARGYYDFSILEAIHQKMQSLLAEHQAKIDYIAYCPHLPEDECYCRKPQPGMLYQIARHFNCSISNIPFVGDKLTDVMAAYAAQATPMVVKTAYPNETNIISQHYPELKIYDDLWEVSLALLAA